MPTNPSASMSARMRARALKKATPREGWKAVSKVASKWAPSVMTACASSVIEASVAQAISEVHREGTARKESGIVDCLHPPE